jgi:hypothetical protein
MKSVQQLSHKLATQWLSADHREQRMLSGFDWPLRLAIGKPSAKMFTGQSLQVQQHLADWRKQKIGRVEWISVKYQSASVPVDMPVCWLIDTVDEWIAASGAPQVKMEFEQVFSVLQQIDPIFHHLIVRHRSLWANKNNLNDETLVRCCQLAMRLESGMAMGRPLRAVSIAGFDSKFLENQRGLLSQLLNIRFAGVLKNQNLEEFLGASEKGEHWLLLKPLARGMVPFQQLRIRASELAQIGLPAQNLIIVENEQCHHQLPEIENTLAILGGGLNLVWLANPHFKTKKIIYWGDIDSWGLKMLAIARHHQPNLQPLLMDLTTFNQYQRFAVPEPSHAGFTSPAGLTETEAELYQILLKSTRGRLEQEYIATEAVKTCLQGMI